MRTKGKRRNPGAPRRLLSASFLPAHDSVNTPRISSCPHFPGAPLSQSLRSSSFLPLPATTRVQVREHRPEITHAAWGRRARAQRQRCAGLCIPETLEALAARSRAPQLRGAPTQGEQSPAQPVRLPDMGERRKHRRGRGRGHVAAPGDRSRRTGRGTRRSPRPRVSDHLHLCLHSRPKLRGPGCTRGAGPKGQAEAARPESRGLQGAQGPRGCTGTGR